MNFDPSDAVILGVIGFVQVVVLAMLAIILKRAETTKKDVAATKEQIVNDHSKNPNFREENDRRHDETRKWVGQLRRQQTDTNRRLRRIDDMFLYIATGDKVNISRYLREGDNEDGS